MLADKDLTRVEAHFAFGDNWAAYAKDISEKDIDEAIEGLLRLLGGDLKGKRFLDVGSGSGIHSLAALRLGASEVVAVDLDPESVATTRRVLESRAPGSSCYRVKHVSVFDLDSGDLGEFDVVYSWGVLHHTGDMDRAIRMAGAMVAPGGEFVFALYHRTWFCPLWTAEKRWYAKASGRGQAIARSIYIAIAVLRRWLKGRSFGRFVREYRSNRGMDFYRDVHDWLGGYPYESLSPDDVETVMRSLGFCRTRRFVRDWLGAQIGLFGSGCDEYAYRRVRSDESAPVSETEG